MSTTRKMGRLFTRWHRALAWVGGIALLIWGVSGIMHPIMVEFGPQQKTFMPPMRALDLQDTKPIDQIAADAGITSAQVVRVVPGEQGSLWQITEAQDKPRRYFDPATGAELADMDRQQAIFLARHYMGETDAGIRSTDFVTEFSGAYPPVNRLLPVWRVAFDRPDDLVMYIYTETSTSAAVNNNFKRPLQAGFQLLHTWSWMPMEAEWARVLIIALLIGCLIAIAFTGLGLLVAVRRARRTPGARGWHRIAGYALVVPLLAFSISGFYHLLHYAGSERTRVLSLAPPIDLTNLNAPIQNQWDEITTGLRVAGLSIVEGPDNTLLYRLGLAPPRGPAPEGDAAIRNARFAGISPNGPALYLDAATGQPWAPGDRGMAVYLAQRHGDGAALLEEPALITRFGEGYDFRNKRLPVWRVTTADDILFVDTATGALADVTDPATLREGWSFSNFHKLNFLNFLGREARHAIHGTIVFLLVIFMGVLGLRMVWPKRKRKAGRAVEAEQT